jgi:hypothetical protein
VRLQLVEAEPRRVELDPQRAVRRHDFHQTGHPGRHHGYRERADLIVDVDADRLSELDYNTPIAGRQESRSHRSIAPVLVSVCQGASHQRDRRIFYHTLREVGQFFPPPVAGDRTPAHSRPPMGIPTARKNAHTRGHPRGGLSADAFLQLLLTPASGVRDTPRRSTDMTITEGHEKPEGRRA